MVKFVKFTQYNGGPILHVNPDSVAFVLESPENDDGPPGTYIQPIGLPVEVDKYGEGSGYWVEGDTKSVLDKLTAPGY